MGYVERLMYTLLFYLSRRAKPKANRQLAGVWARLALPLT
jgi:hypothetical protein